MLEIIIAVYISGLILAMVKLWYPIYSEIKKESQSLLARYPITLFLVVLITFMLSWPLVMWCSLDDNKAEQFINAFVKGALGK
tara:strand:- start:1435 stop:1683 length:249 start_codon:yes stop_codon:yes gene_type:complete